uniref:Cadherin domain-containing protein n=1 Tax=Strigamia maritima TaxID=126957 RepID=T1ING2_STRMM
MWDLTFGLDKLMKNRGVNISINDVNDNAPEFASHIVRISVSENSSPNTLLYTAHASDPDSGENGTIIYELIHNPENSFIIDPLTGRTTLRTKLDYEKSNEYSVIVGASDRGREPLRSNMTLKIQVQDVNDNAPIFAKPVYDVNVIESEAVNAQLVQVKASDADSGNNARLTYKLETSEHAGVFGVFPNNGWVYLKRSLDREQRDAYRLVIVARDNGSPVMSATCTVELKVGDVNDNDPQFPKESYVFAVEENADTGSRVGRIRAGDKDAANNGAVRYGLGLNATYFKINHMTGEIVTTSKLDREWKAVHDFVATATDGGTPPRNAQVRVQVKVNDVNDNPPIFIDPYDDIITVREEGAPGTEFVRVSASDPDAGFNGTVSYFLDKANGEDSWDVFDIDSETGVMSTKLVLDQELKQMYRVTIIAKDGGTPPLESRKELKIEVVDSNDNRPIFSASSFDFHVPENTSAGERIGSVAAHDTDDGRITYNIANGNLYDTFEINKTSGTLFLAHEVDYEKTSHFVLQIRAVDASTSNLRESLINLTLTIDDVNDNAPVFEKDPILLKLAEDVLEGSVVWNFSAVDADGGVNGLVSYAILHQSPEKAFRVDETTGALTVVKTLDYELHPEYMLVMAATDRADDPNRRLSTSATARIILVDVNDNAPYFTSRSRIDVMEDEPIGYPIVHLIALDRDSGDNGKITYGIASGNEAGYFALDPLTGLLTLAKRIDREVSTRYVLNVTATDNGVPALSTHQLIDVFIEDLDDNPPRFERSVYLTNISEDASVGSLVVKLKAIDPDSGTNVNLTYFIPSGIADEKFVIDPITGEMRTNAKMDREDKSSYTVTVYVRDGSLPTQYDTATVLVDLIDINDNYPEFHDSCYPLSVPENSELSVIHNVVAMDRDAGLNGDVSYTITKGNVGNKFSIDPQTGQLASAPLDREVVSIYRLTITARDRGNPPQYGSCNVTIHVEDQNDNDPRFLQNRYETRIPEDAAINTTVLVVKASDADEGVNARITYSLSNETQWLFKIDSETGVITTSGVFDREKKASYSFEVRATDGGKYDARSEKTLVVVTITDVNDNKPLFQKYPMNVEVPSNMPPGSLVLTVVANDKDLGKNSEIIYSFVGDHRNKFRIDPDTGQVVVVGSLAADSGKFYHIEVLAQDKGNPPLSSTGVIEIRVGDNTGASVLKFQNSTYRVRLLENAPLGQEVVRVVAVRNDGKQSGIMYSFGNGNEDDTFDIDPTTGVISVKDSRRLDYEMTQRLKLIVVAHADTLLPMYGYATVRIDLIDQNDNPPRFTQDRYVSSVWEGQNKGTFVMQVSASDEDSGSYGSIVYHIVDGNHDNAFVIEPPFSGIVKTNIVLDREIRDVYRITIIATDEGGPHLTGTCTLRINIIDVNDNQPTFPPHNEVNVTEGADVGSLVTTITANDVDTNPALTYSFAQDGNPDQMFSIDRYSGKITLSQLLDHEAKSQYRLTVEASDTTHVARTTLIVNVVDENDNPPVFSQQSYQVTLSEMTEPGYAVITVNATDNDTGENARIMYSMGIAPVDGFYINENTGEIFTNKTISFDPTQPTIQLVITARDHGRPSLAAVVAVRIQVTDLNNVEPKFLQQIYTTRIVENTPRGTTVVRVKAADFEQTQQSHRLVYYIITSGNEERKFEINSNTGDIILVNQLDREMRALYTLHVTARDRNYPSHNATAEVLIYVEDINDNSPVFNQSDYVINVSEKVRIGQQLVKVYALDPDDGDNAKVKYDITSGNIQGMFELKRDTGVVVVRKPLDYEKVREYKLVVRAVDNHPDKPLTGIATVHVNVEDENDNAPEFPVFQYLEFVEENVPIGSPVFTARAYDSDKGMYGKVNYSITDGDGKHKFLVEPHTGLVTTNYVFDFETRNRYHFIIKARDAGGKFATARVQVDVESKDEFAPEFTLGSYQYTVPSSAQANYMVGRVQATDKDKGPDGRVVYTLREPHPNFRVNRTTGLITVKGPLKKPQQQLREGPNILLVTASSGRPNSLTSTAEVLIVVDYYKNGTELGAANEEASTGLAGWALGLVVALTILAASLFTVIVFLRLRSRRCGKPALAHEFESSFDTIDIRPPPTTSNVSSRFPPHYNDLHHYDTADANCCGNLTSGVSDQSHSASSGRGSAEEGDDGDDEEIRMINEQPLIQQKLRERLGMPDSGIQHDDEDNSSDISVRNTQEYLARLGIDTTRKVPQSMESMHMFDDEGGGEGDITNLIYAKLNEVGADDMKFANESMTGSLSSIVHSEEELTGSYNWDYLLDWGPRYQPLAHVFAEIARLKDDTVAHNNHHHHHHRKNNIKSVPPPLLTAVAPRSIAPVALNRTSQMASLCSLPRSPISHDSSLTSLALSPSFSPSLSPLATRSPSISPLVTPIGGNSSSDNSTSRHSQSQSQRSSLLTTGAFWD